MSDSRTQARLRPVIRVFISSTFSDMKHERNALEADAFPKLEQLCQRHGFQFQAIDLRWGVSTEAGLDHRTMRICFDELRRAQEISPKPNFLILLGNRYGWRPLPEEISVEEFYTLEHAATQIPDSADKSAVAVLREWYREDTNAAPPVYLLQSRRQDLGDDQDYTHDAVWNQAEVVLWTIINRAMPPQQLRRRFDVAALDGSLTAIVRFQASATEQEIWHGALRVPDAREHVLAFFRDMENLATFSDPKQIKDFVDVDPSGSVEVALQAEQDRLKAELRQRLGSASVFRNEAPAWLVEAQDNQGGRTADVTTGHLAQLCVDVVSRLSEIIQGQIEEYWCNTAQASMDRAARELEIEQREYERFARERGGEESFVGRQVELQAILDYVGSDSRWPLVIHGASGCGKTALLARASQEVAKTRKRIERFIGVAPRSSDLRSLLSSLCQELRHRNPRGDALPAEIKQLRGEFSQHLQVATSEQPLILFLDALDQLADVDNGRLLHWLPPGSLPAHVKLVVSCLSDRSTGDPAGQPYVELKRRQIPNDNFINLDVLSAAEARLLLFDRWLPKAARKVSDDQRARIEQRLASPACRQPIFLKLLFEEVQLWHSYDPAPVPGESAPSLLGQLFDRLSQSINHGPLLVNRLLGYLSASRHGLAENEILEILFADPEYRAKLDEATEQTRHELPPNAKRIPIALWSRLRFDLAPYLTERTAPGANVLTFYHRQVAEWVREHLRAPQNQNWHPHARLAAYFRDTADPTNDGQWLGRSPRAYTELSHHQLAAGQEEQLREEIMGFRYMQAKLNATDSTTLLTDFETLGGDQGCSLVQQALALSVPILAHDKHQLASQMLGRLWKARGRAGIDGFLAELLSSQPRPHLLPQMSVFEASADEAALATFEGHRSELLGALQLNDDSILTWSIDETLRRWDLDGHELAVFRGHESPVTGALELSDGTILSWSDPSYEHRRTVGKSPDNTLRRWDKAGQQIAVFHGHGAGPSGALQLSDGNVLSWSGGRHKTDHGVSLRRWDGFGQQLSGFEDHRNITHAQGLSDGTVLTWSNSEMAASDDKLRRWSVDGQPVVVFDTNPTDVLLLSDGSLISWSDRRDGHVLQRWTSDGCQIATLQRGSRHHRVNVKGAFELSDGSIVSWAVSDAFGGEVVRFDPSGGELAAFVPNGDSGSPKGAMELIDGSIMVWSGMAYSNHREGFLNRWDVDGSHLALFRGHEDSVEGSTQLSDGSIVSWASDGTVRRWNIDGREVGVLHKADCPSTLRGALRLRDGGLLLWSDRHNVSGGASAVKRIDLAAQPAGGRERHSSGAKGLLGLDDGTVLSWADDGILRRWGMDGESLSALRIYTSGGIGGVRRLRDGSLLLWTSLVKPPKLGRWSIDGKQLVVFERHGNDIEDALELADGSILSWSRWGYSGTTMRLSDIEGNALATFEAFGVVGAMKLSDGTLLSWTSDSPATCGTLYHWDRSGNRLASLNHRTGVRGAIELPDGKILSWSGSNYYGKSELDNTLKLWDLRNPRCSLIGIPLVTFEGHRFVQGARWLPDGSIISWGDAVRRWSMDGRQIALFESGLYEDDRESLFAWAREQGFDPNVLYPKTEEPYLGSTARVTGRGKHIDVYCRFSGRRLSRVIADTDITCLGVLPGGVVAAGTDHGRVLFFRWTDEAVFE